MPVDVVEVFRTAQDSQNVEVIQGGRNQACGLDQSPTQGQQGEAPVDRIENQVKSGDEGHIDREDGEIAGDAKTKEPFVRHDVQRRLRGVAGDDEAPTDIELRKDGGNERTQVRRSDNPRRLALPFVRRVWIGVAAWHRCHEDGRRASRPLGMVTPFTSSHDANTGANASAGTH